MSEITTSKILVVNWVEDDRAITGYSMRVASEDNPNYVRGSFIHFSHMPKLAETGHTIVIMPIK